MFSTSSAVIIRCSRYPCPAALVPPVVKRLANHDDPAQRSSGSFIFYQPLAPDLESHETLVLIFSQPP